MSLSLQLQGRIYELLIEDASVHALCGDRIYDNVPESRSFPYVSFGASDTVEDDADCITGEVETLQIDCWSRYKGGFKELKQITGAVKEALHSRSGDLETDALVEMRVVGIRHFRDPDGLTSHGVVTVQAILEEA